VALSALMRRPDDRRAELYVEGLKRIASSGENDYRRFLLVECLEAYAELDDDQKERLQALLQTDPYQEVESLMKTTYERGIEQGIERRIEQGIERGIEQGERRLTLRLMEAKFGPLSPKVKQQVEALSPEALTQLQLDLLNAQAIGELRLGD
jgi:DNA-binding SARP family transcriptional activator